MRREQLAPYEARISALALSTLNHRTLRRFHNRWDNLFQRAIQPQQVKSEKILPTSRGNRGHLVQFIPPRVEGFAYSRMLRHSAALIGREIDASKLPIGLFPLDCRYYQHCRSICFNLYVLHFYFWSGTMFGTQSVLISHDCCFLQRLVLRRFHPWFSLFHLKPKRDESR